MMRRSTLLDCGTQATGSEQSELLWFRGSLEEKNFMTSQRKCAIYFSTAFGTQPVARRDGIGVALAEAMASWAETRMAMAELGCRSRKLRLRNAHRRDVRIV